MARSGHRGDRDDGTELPAGGGHTAQRVSGLFSFFSFCLRYTRERFAFVEERTGG